MPKTSSSRRRPSDAKKQIVLYKKKTSSGRRKKSSSKSHSSSKRDGISEDALLVLLLAKTENQGQNVDNVLPFLLLSGNSLKHSALPLVILHLQNSKSGSNSQILPWLLAFQHGQVPEDQLLLLLLGMRDGNGGFGGLGNGFGSQGMNILGAMGRFGGGFGKTIGTLGLFNGNQNDESRVESARRQIMERVSNMTQADILRYFGLLEIRVGDQDMTLREAINRAKRDLGVNPDNVPMGFRSMQSRYY